MTRDNVKSKKNKTGRKWGKLVIVVTEGEKTEPGYLNELRSLNSDAWNRNRTVLIYPGKGGNVSQLIEKMKNKISGIKLRPGDETWIVVDDDGRGAETIGKLIDWQNENPEFNKLGASNPLFEYWLLLHFEDGNAVINKKDCVKRLEQRLQSELQNRKFRYKKGFPSKFITLDRIKDAVKRAKEKDKIAFEKWPEIRSSRVYLLVESLLEVKLKI